ncbi:MAG: hypothetical protein AB1563_11015, partial [Bacillota bacterium]
LIQLRRGSAALRRGDMRWLLVDDPTRTFAFSRTCGNDVVVVAVCAGERQVTLDLNLDPDLGQHLHLHPAQAPRTTACNVRTFSDALTGRTYPVVDGRVRLEHLGPHQAAVLVAGEPGAPVS